jgi:serine/threonine protein phosphatase 1
MHGCSQALLTILEALKLEFSDTLITLGDYVDRGPDSSGVVEILANLVGQCRLIPLLGNHEVMMLNAASGRDRGLWKDAGGDATLASYGGSLRNVPQHHRIFFQHCKHFHETESAFFVHANYDYDLPLEDQHDEVLLWAHIRDEPPPPHASGKRAFVGHTPQLDGEIRSYPHVVLMDTFCYGGMWLSAMDVETEKVWQADNHGRLRIQ